MKEITIITTKINLVLANGGTREHVYTMAFASARNARQYINGMQAYRDAYRDALETLDENVEYWLPDSKQCQTLVLQPEV